MDFPTDYDLYEALGFDPLDTRLYDLSEFAIRQQIRAAKAQQLTLEARGRLAVAIRVLGRQQERCAYNEWRRSLPLPPTITADRELSQEISTPIPVVVPGQHPLSRSERFRERYGYMSFGGMLNAMLIDLGIWWEDCRQTRYDRWYKRKEVAAEWFFQNPLRWAYVAAGIVVIVGLVLVILLLANTI